MHETLGEDALLAAVWPEMLDGVLSLMGQLAAVSSCRTPPMGRYHHAGWKLRVAGQSGYCVSAFTSASSGPGYCDQ
jgi:hypothetical protein